MYLLTYKFAATFYAWHVIAIPVQTDFGPILFENEAICKQAKALLDENMVLVPGAVAMRHSMTVDSRVESDCEPYQGN